MTFPCKLIFLLLCLTTCETPIFFSSRMVCRLYFGPFFPFVFMHNPIREQLSVPISVGKIIYFAVNESRRAGDEWSCGGLKLHCACMSHENVPPGKTSQHVHTHKHAYIYIYTCSYTSECVHYVSMCLSASLSTGLFLVITFFPFLGCIISIF